MMMKNLCGVSMIILVFLPPLVFPARVYQTRARNAKRGRTLISRAESADEFRSKSPETSLSGDEEDAEIDCKGQKSDARVDLSTVEHIPLHASTVDDLKTQLETLIKEAKQAGNCFYIGVTQACGTPIQSVCKRSSSTACTQTHAHGCNGKSIHHADKYTDQKISEVFYTDANIQLEAAWALEAALIKKHRPKHVDHDLCLNRKIENEKERKEVQPEGGIVYLRIYTNEQTTNNGGATSSTMSRKEL